MAKTIVAVAALTALLALAVAGAVAAASMDTSYFKLTVDDEGNIVGGVSVADAGPTSGVLSVVSKAVLVDSGKDLVPGYSYKFLLKAHAWREYVVYTKFYGAGLKLGESMLVGIVAERPWSNVGIDIYLRVWDKNGDLVYEKKLGHFGITDSHKSWTLHVEARMTCDGQVDLAIYDDLGSLVTWQSYRADEAQDIYWVPYSAEADAGTAALTSSEDTCPSPTITGTPLTETGTPTPPPDKPYNPLLDWKWMIGFGLLVIGAAAFLRR